ncbi:MAG: hypothetical protein ACUVXF_06315 [Desulfobaccales bacterium]
MRLRADCGERLGRIRRLVPAFLLLLTAGVWGCGHIRPVPEGFEPAHYQAVSLEQLRAPRPSGLLPGQKVRVDGYFWQFLDYDPCVVPNYLTMVRQPLAWSRLRWAAMYESASMHGYYDRLALNQEQQRDWKLKRLEPVRVFGELAPLGFGALYLRVHHFERLEVGGVAEHQEGPLPAEVGQESPRL